MAIDKRLLQEDAEFIEKLSFSGKDFLKNMVPHAGAAAVMAGLAGTYGYFSSKGAHEKHKENLTNSFEALRELRPSYTKAPQEFAQRFNELTLISPTLASNPRLADKIIQPRLTKGFDLDDIHRLSSIEYHTALAPKVHDPVDVAKSNAVGAFGRWINILAPAAVVRAMTPSVKQEVRSAVKTKEQTEKRMDEQSAKEVQKLRETFSKWREADPEKAKGLQDIAKNPELLKHLMEKRMGMGKQGSGEMLVSEECLARMLADRYMMYKTAAPAASFFGKGLDAMGKHFQIMGPALAAAGGITLLTAVMKGAENEKLRREADNVFAGLRRTNEFIKSEPALAAEAFDVLRTFAPSLAVKPLIARTFVENIVKGGQLPVDQAQLLAKTEEMHRKATEGTNHGFIEGLKSPMSLFTHSISTHGKK